ncbi:alkaline phosphatase family protein [Reichenbachiella sp. MALMAid0571]|uniref:LamG-like jellyroll fold domain-containing protein n=1 Tax=Reichenbachiella sp. MALMAid0571 TaxID=3143939 RepID=UPI0032DF226C
MNNTYEVNLNTFMKKLFILLITIISNLCAVQAQKVNKVLIFGLDGARPDAIQFANTPNIDALTANGTYSWDALNEGTTSSGPGWSNILTGVWQNKHGVNDNSFSGSNYSTYPPLFKYIEDFNRQLFTVSVCEWSPINNSIVGNYADETINTTGSADTEAKVISYLKFGNPDLLFVHLDSPDGAGHGYGFSSDVPQYVSTLEAVDTSIGKMLEALASRPKRDNENWLILLTTDHGGLGQSHGGNSIEERNIFFIASGDNVEKKKTEKSPGEEKIIEPVENCLNDPVELYFDGNNDYIQIPESPLLDFGTSQDFSVEVRIRTATAADVSIVGNKDWGTGRNKGFVFSFSSGTWKVNVGDGGFSNRVDINGNNVSDNEWHTLSATFDRDGDLKIYEDGTLAGSKSLTNIGDITTGLPFSIGADGLKAYDYKGYIAEVRVFNNILDATDIDTWKCKKLDNTHSKYDNLIGYWRLVDGENVTTVADLSSSKLDGSLTGAIWEDATDSETIIEYDYSETPRQVDVVATALEYLCIPIDPDWKLDGEIVGVTCVEPVIASLSDNLEARNLMVYPNPSNDGQSLNLIYSGNKSGQKAVAILYDNTGKKISKQKMILEEKMTFDVKDIPPGIYNLVLELKSNQLKTGHISIK